MDEANLEEKGKETLQSILHEVRISATATSEVSDEKKAERIEQILVRALTELGVQE